MAEFIEGLCFLKDKIINKAKRRAGKEQLSKDLMPEEVLGFIKAKGEKPVKIYSPDSPPFYVDPNKISSKFLDKLADYSVVYLEKPPNQSRTAYVVKCSGVFKTDFIEGWFLKSGDIEALRQKIKERWQKLVDLGWPVFVWHGTSLEAKQTILNTKKHFLFLRETFTDSLGYAAANGEAVLGYAMPAADLSVAMSLTARKMGLKSPRDLDYTAKEALDSKNNKEQRFYIDLNNYLRYPYSGELEDYLEASNINFSIVADGNNKFIRVPILQRYYQKSKGDFLAEFNLDTQDKVPKENQARSWRSDLYDPEVIVFKDNTSIRVMAKEIPVPK